MSSGSNTNYKSGPQCNKPVDDAHWVVKFIHVQLVALGMTRTELARRSGVPEKTLRGWWNARRGVQPKIGNVESVLEALGLQLKTTWLEAAHDSSDTASRVKPSPS